MDSQISIIMNEELLQKLHYVTEELFYPIGTNITTNNLEILVFLTLHRTLLSYIYANPQHKGRRRGFKKSAIVPQSGFKTELKLKTEVDIDVFASAVQVQCKSVGKAWPWQYIPR